MNLRLFFIVRLRMIWLLAVLFSTVGQTVLAVEQPREVVVRAAIGKCACVASASSNHSEALPADTLVWTAGLGLLGGSPSTALLPTLPAAQYSWASWSSLLSCVPFAAYLGVVRIRLLRATLYPNAP